MTKSGELFERAKKVIPGGVNSPVRAFKSVGGEPRFIKSAKGSRLFDEDGNSYLDFVAAWGPIILGHAYEPVLEAVTKAVTDGLCFGTATELEVTMAELMVETVKSLESVRMVNSGTEAVISAVRLARGYTGKDKIIKFEGCYHGHGDSMLVKAGSGLLTHGTPDSAGVPAAVANDTLIAQYNDLESVDRLFQENPGKIAAVIIEPVAANMGVVLPKEGFLAQLKALCNKNNALLIFDEVITGFRLAKGGAQEYFGVEADIVTYGKIIGGGLPIGAYGGKKEIMKHISPLGDVYQAGTLSGNPICMTAGIATLTELNKRPEIYQHINGLGTYLAENLRKHTKNTVNQIGSLCCMFCTEQPVTDYASAKTSDTKKYADFFNYLLNKGIYIAPAQFEAMFISMAHCKEDMDLFTETYISFTKEQ